MTRPVEWVEYPDESFWRVSSYDQITSLVDDDRLATPRPDARLTGGSAAHRVLVRLAAGNIRDRTSARTEGTIRRKAMNRAFAPDRVARVHDRIEEIARCLLADLRDTNTGASIDLTGLFSKPLSAHVICELLDVPPDDASLFQRWADDRQHSDNRRVLFAVRELLQYSRAIVAARRAAPGDDIVSELLEHAPSGDEHADDRVANVLAFMVGQGWELAAHAIDWGVILLKGHPAEFERWRAGAASDRSMVEEVLRLFNSPATIRGGARRRADDDIELFGEHIREGDSVRLDFSAANRDGAVFDDPEIFDVARDPNPHLSFGLGLYRCPFNKVARLDVEVGLTSLFTHFPALELCEPADELRSRFERHAGPLHLGVRLLPSRSHGSRE